MFATPPTAPSVPHPETAERRAEATRRTQDATGLNDAVLEHLVRAFYEAARKDAIIGHLFSGVHDWERHIATITTFWSSISLATGQYEGQPLPPHIRLNLRPEHFRRWLTLFEATARDICPEPAVALLMEKANRIAQSFQMAISVMRGELPPRSTARPQETSIG